MDKTSEEFANKLAEEKYENSYGIVDEDFDNKQRHRRIGFKQGQYISNY